MSLVSSNRVLVVDDDEITLALIAYRLQKEGFIVDYVRDGVAAIERLRSGAYTVVVLDLLMPRLDGFGVLHFINQQLPDLRSHVIIVTSTSDGRIEGTFRTLRKPIDFAELASAARECAELSRMSAAASWFLPSSSHFPN